MTTVLHRSDPETGRARPRGPRGGGRQLGRPRSLPNGRALLGAFLVAAAATIVLSAWLATTTKQGERWVVAARTLAAGTRLDPGDLTSEVMTLPGGPTAAGAFRSAAPLIGRVLAVALPAGELVQHGALVASGTQPSLRPVTISLDAGSASDLSTNATVDVLLTVGTGRQTATSVVVRGATVVSITPPGSSLVASSGGDTVTLGVHSFAEVEAVVHAEHTGTVSVVVGEPSDGSGLGAPR